MKNDLLVILISALWWNGPGLMALSLASRTKYVDPYNILVGNPERQRQFLRMGAVLTIAAVLVTGIGFFANGSNFELLSFAAVVALTPPFLIGGILLINALTPD